MGIYILGHPDLPNVKIGYTADDEPSRRMASLETGSMGYRLASLAWMKQATVEQERRLHGLLREAGAHAHREWFLKDHGATGVVIHHARQANPSAARIIRYLQNHLRDTPDISGESSVHRAVMEDVSITVHSMRKRCTGCNTWLPVTTTLWGSLWISGRTAEGVSFRDQPRCLKCRTAPEYFRDDRTLDMWEN